MASGTGADPAATGSLEARARPRQRARDSRLRLDMAVVHEEADPERLGGDGREEAGPRDRGELGVL